MYWLSNWFSHFNTKLSSFTEFIREDKSSNFLSIKNLINQSGGLFVFVHCNGWCLSNQPTSSTSLTSRGSTPILNVPSQLGWMRVYGDLYEVGLTVRRVVRGIVFVFGIFRRCENLLRQIVQRVIIFTITGRRHNGQSIGQFWHLFDLISLSQQNTLWNVYFKHSPHEYVNSQLERIFSNMFPSDRWTIVESSLAKVGCHRIAMAIDGPPGNVMTVGELH